MDDACIRGSFRRLHRGFSLIELLCVIGLIGVLGALTIGAGGRYLSAQKPDLEVRAFEAIREARKRAVEAAQPVELRYLAEGHRLLWLPDRGVALGDGAEIRFLPATQGESVLLAGRLVEKALPRVRFFPDGSCDAFRLELRQAGRGAWQIAIDPWTGAALAAQETGGNR